MKKIYVGIMLLGAVLLFGYQANAATVDSVKIVIGEVSITNPHPDVTGMHVSCEIYNYTQNGKKTRGEGNFNSKTINFNRQSSKSIGTNNNVAYFSGNNTLQAKNVVLEKTFDSPVDLKGAGYQCSIVVHGKGNVRSHASRKPLNPVGKVVQCTPFIAGECQVVENF